MAVRGNTSKYKPRLSQPLLWPIRCIALLVFATGIAPAQDVLMHHYDAYRSGVQSHETQLTPANVGPHNFGKLFSMKVDGAVYAQPLWVGGYTMNDGKAHNVLFIATQHDSVYAYDADGKGPTDGFYWRVNLLAAGEATVSSADTYTTDINPQIGITGTPVIDRAAGVLYVVAKSKLVSGANTTYYQRLHALNLSTGAEMMNGPIEIAASVPGTGYDAVNGVISFNARKQNQRSALTLADGSVWIAWASHGDNDPYHGWIIGYDSSDLTKQTGVFNTTPDGQRGGIWMSGGGLSVDAEGNLYGASANGDFNENTGGLNYSSTIFKFKPSAAGLAVSTSFTPDNQASLSSVDSDMGTSSCTLIDNPTAGAAYPHLLVTTDKDGEIYVVDRDKMGGYMPNSNGDIQEFSDGGGSVHQSFAFFNNQLYLAADGRPLSAWTFNPATGLFKTEEVTAPDSKFGCDGCDGSGGTPSISANGSQDGIVWLIDNTGFNTNPAVLHAYDAALTTELYNSTWAANNVDQADSAVKFTTPTIANGHVYVGGGSSVTVYGRHASAPFVTATPRFSPAFGPQTSAITVTITDATPGAVIHYTLDGTEPTVLSPVYSAPLSVTSTTQISAMAAAAGYVAGASRGGVYLYGTKGDIFTFNSAFTPSAFAVNGSANVHPSRIQLTDSANDEAGSVFYRVPVKVTNFNVSFDFQMTNAYAHGLTFVVQNQGLSALGPDGGGLGYGPSLRGGTPGISPSAAIKFDLYNNQGEGDNSTGFYEDGAAPTTPAYDLTPSLIDLHSNHIFSTQIAYNGQVITETLTDTATLKSYQKTYKADLVQTLGASTALMGFTGSSGGAGVTTEILNWSYSVPHKESYPAAGWRASVNGPALVPYADVSFPQADGVEFPAAAAGQSFSFPITTTDEATFAVSLISDSGVEHGIVQLSIDGTNLGSPLDSYAASPSLLNVNFGNILLTKGTHTFEFKVTGKNAASSGYEATFGELVLTP